MTTRVFGRYIHRELAEMDFGGRDVKFFVQSVDYRELGDEDRDWVNVYIDLWEPKCSNISLAEMERASPFLDVVFTKYGEFRENHPGISVTPTRNMFVHSIEKKVKDPVAAACGKEFSVSFLTGRTKGPGILTGYMERHHLWENRGLVSCPSRMWSSNPERLIDTTDLNRLPGDNRGLLYKSMFNICIENCRQADYFTEKIRDCFLTMTLPVYIGCPNIGDYFDMDGIIVADDWRHAIGLCNSLSEADYWSRLDSMHANWVLAEEGPWTDILNEITNRL